MFDWLTHEVSQSAITHPVIALACATDVVSSSSPTSFGDELPEEMATEPLGPDLRICFTSQTRERRWS